jgi:hypothetical protein
MEPYRKICKIISINHDDVTVEIEDNKTFNIKRIKLSESAALGDFLKHCEHGFYDIVDEQGNFIHR